MTENIFTIKIIYSKVVLNRMGDIVEESLYIVWLTAIAGIGRKKIKKLLDYYEYPSRIWNTSSSGLTEDGNVDPDTVYKIISSKDEGMVYEYVEKMEAKGIKYISVYDDAYPKLLMDIADYPLGFYMLGNEDALKSEKVSMVGARRCSEYGGRVAFDFAAYIASRGVAVVSGMAKGIDAMSHKGALSVEGKTIAVLGNGVDICYPAENRGLYESIIKTGAVISEYPLGEEAKPHYFPERNRIISGLSKGVLVVEAAKRSGTLITVDCALENGREVFVVPGNITSPLSEGTNSLISQGCPIVTKPEEILEALDIKENVEEKKDGKNFSKPFLAPEEEIVYHCIGYEPKGFDELKDSAGISVQDLQYILTLLELGGYVERLSGQRYIKIS
ncbi:MAG: DNA-processing protein DprA [Lachnospiraceae bacterium]|nr:DNA-processing protein DprA [Lachnospiraceae bacterium]